MNGICPGCNEPTWYCECFPDCDCEHCLEEREYAEPGERYSQEKMDEYIEEYSRKRKK